MRTSAAIAHYKRPAAIAKALGISRAAVAKWGEVVPEGSAYKLESLTGGALRVDRALYGQAALQESTAPTVAA